MSAPRPAHLIGGTRLVGLLALVVLVSSCRMDGVVPDSQMTLDVANGTDIRLELVVNGHVVAAFPPGGAVELASDKLPQLPWDAVVRFPDGRGIVALIVRSGDIVATSTSSKGDGARVDLSCGRIDMWSGPPMSGPIPGDGTPGDCNP
ncbi:MAG: hypothetical protein ABI573_12165 [Chloroflexota bacterium]